MSTSSIPPDFPALPPPAGVQSNFIDPPSQATALICLNAIFLALMLIVVTVRMYVKGRVLHNLGWDDCEPFIPNIRIDEKPF
jgi:hypothetical protein